MEERQIIERMFASPEDHVEFVTRNMQVNPFFEEDIRMMTLAIDMPREEEPKEKEVLWGDY